MTPFTSLEFMLNVKYLGTGIQFFGAYLIFCDMNRALRTKVEKQSKQNRNILNRSKMHRRLQTSL